MRPPHTPRNGQKADTGIPMLVTTSQPNELHEPGSSPHTLSPVIGLHVGTRCFGVRPGGGYAQGLYWFAQYDTVLKRRDEKLWVVAGSQVLVSYGLGFGIISKRGLHVW
ncbi:hypothetical protein L873DRAFT_1811700 [Choiromyces venosus 120613-1]|uniref:Uncharacterized protein n=1 Tax=Choiromyces venosus 120613-1 TaxID=1336337 RepID=A0A3N4JDD4_9PEZI|nr:hypothetical protein L873DRAFT_1811700 [Choiromyces venosus 120613-1]